jgi:hypothetical protein
LFSGLVGSYLPERTGLDDPLLQSLYQRGPVEVSVKLNESLQSSLVNRGQTRQEFDLPKPSAAKVDQNLEL